MLKVKVMTIGKCKESWLAEGLAEYEKRLKGRAAIEWLLARDEAQLEEWVRGEVYVALDPKGKLMTSEEWSREVVRLGARQTYVIGGAEGLAKGVRAAAAGCWSLSPLTFTHQVTRLVLVEQIYRALEIERGSQYHK